MKNKNWENKDFSGDPVVRTCRFHCQGLGSTSGWGTEIRQVVRCSQKQKKDFFFFLIGKIEMPYTMSRLF